MSSVQGTFVVRTVHGRHRLPILRPSVLTRVDRLHISIVGGVVSMSRRNISLLRPSVARDFRQVNLFRGMDAITVRV